VSVAQENDSVEPSPTGFTRRTVLSFATLAAAIGVDLAAQIIAANPAYASTAPWTHPFLNRRSVPVDGEYLNNASFRDGYPHSGVDLNGAANQDVYNCAPGTVVWAGLGGGRSAWGYWVQISHSGGTKTAYAHLAPNSIAVSVDQTLTAPTVIGKVGGSGEDGALVYPKHLHVSKWSGSTLVDPTHLVSADLPIPGQVPVAAPLGGSGMTTRFAKIGSGDGGLNTWVALAGDVGYPCPGNFQEYARTVTDSSNLDRAAKEYAVHGPLVWVPAALWSDLKKAYTEVGATAGIPQTVSLSAEDRALLVDIANRLPVEPA
jgi:murein DD-endopeptidase MepM/ murein hydrolase activator NlpD